MKPSNKINALAISVGVLLANFASAANPIDYAPQDTPYLIAATKPMSADAYARVRQDATAGMEMVSAFMKDVFKKMAEKRTTEGKENIDMAPIVAFMEELFDVARTDESLRKAGFKPNPLVAFYGVGAVPVMRMEVENEAAVNATLAAWLEKVVVLSKADTAKAKNAESKPFIYTKKALRKGSAFYLGDADVQLFVLVENKQIVVSLLPKAAPANLLDLVAPKSPVKSKVVLNKVAAMQKRYGLNEFSFGYVEFEPLANFWLGKGNALEKALWKTTGEKELPAADATCQAEFKSIARNVPRMAFGHREFSGRRVDQFFALELEPQLAKSFAATNVSMPAYGGGQVFRFGLATDLMKMMNVVRTQATKIIDAPYKCEQLAKLNLDAQKTKEAMANPALGMAAMVKGFGISIENMSLDVSGITPKPSNVTANVALFSDTPEALVGMAAAQMPQIAAMELAPGKPPVALDASFFTEATAPMLERNEGFAVMSDKALIVGVGEGRAKALAQLANAPVSSQQAVMNAGYGTKFGAFMSSFYQLSVKSMPDAEAESFKSIMAMQSQMYERIENMSFEMVFTDNGVELRSDVRFKAVK